ncbi:MULTISPECIES: hypothetical protein [unclassified Mesorhizobium]|uniref:hypothetical protein n=1 Tax=unclassified Mesorhizobium TaxID=325217 RepID=UPI0012EA33EA|nr:MULTISPECIES: hypothetical protein [unclassified Mesorhizobium]
MGSKASAAYLNDVKLKHTLFPLTKYFVKTRLWRIVSLSSNLRARNQAAPVTAHNVRAPAATFTSLAGYKSAELRLLASDTIAVAICSGRPRRARKHTSRSDP